MRATLPQQYVTFHTSHFVLARKIECFKRIGKMSGFVKQIYPKIGAKPIFCAYFKKLGESYGWRFSEIVEHVSNTLASAKPQSAVQITGRFS